MLFLSDLIYLNALKTNLGYSPDPQESGLVTSKHQNLGILGYSQLQKGDGWLKNFMKKKNALRTN